MLRPPNREIALLAPLTFAIVGYSSDYTLVSPLGTGFFVAPYVAVTAKHVVEGLWRELALPWHQNRYPTKPRPVDDEFKVRLFQIVDPTAPWQLATWDATGTTRAGYTDIAFLNVVPENEVAERYRWPHGFPELQLVPPSAGANISSVGYPGMVPRFVPGKPGFVVDAKLLVENGIMVEDHEEGRGSWRFPHFETTARFRHGMSGAPVVHEGRICGVVSYASTDERESYAAALWLLLLQETPRSVDPRQNNLPFLDLLRNGVLQAPAWRDVERRASVDRTSPERPMARLRRIVAG
jgi:hypothetical protein